MNSILVYIAGPYSSSTAEGINDNVNFAIWEGEKVLSITNCIPFIPHLLHFWDTLVGGKSYDTWMNIDDEYLKRCDVVLRIPGNSAGADKECERAIELDIPVMHSIDELRMYVNQKNA